MLSIDTQPSLAHELKQVTSLAHQELEDLIVPQLQGVQSLQDYANLLALFYGFNKPVEDAIHQVLDATLLPDIQQRRKAHLLLSDLKSIGSSDQPSTCTITPDIHTVEQAFGALYVLEGSTLGGKSITQLLLKTNVGLELKQLRFFNAYGKETGPMWLTFLHHLNAFSTEAQHATIIHTANETFLKFKHWIQQQPPVL